MATKPRSRAKGKGNVTKGAAQTPSAGSTTATTKPAVKKRIRGKGTSAKTKVTKGTASSSRTRGLLHISIGGRDVREQITSLESTAVQQLLDQMRMGGTIGATATT